MPAAVKFRSPNCEVKVFAIFYQSMTFLVINDEFDIGIQSLCIKVKVKGAINKVLLLALNQR